MSDQEVRSFSREFKLRAVQRMEAGATELLAFLETVRDEA